MQAMIITAYRDVDGLRKMLCALSKHTLCFVHVDQKGEISPEDIRRLNEIPNVQVISLWRVNWGSITHLYAILECMRLALGDQRVTYLHLISAQDFPTISATEWERRFAMDDRIHLQRIKTADYPELAHRYEHFHFMRWLNYRDMSEQAQNWVGRIDRWQEALHIRRHLSLPYKGLVWCSMPRDAAVYALEAPQNRKLLRLLRFTYIPEEFYFQNAFQDTDWEERITGEPLRFSIWDEPERGTPALLNERDIPAVLASGCVLCRKVDPSTPLFDRLSAIWNGEDKKT